jgi:hypothetical protein
VADRPVDRAGLAFGVAFVVVGVLLLLDRLGVISLRASVVLPILLIALGLAVLLGGGPSGSTGRGAG